MTNRNAGLLEAIAFARQRALWREAYLLAQDMPAQWAIIREAYAAQMPLILERSRQHLRARIDPYVVDWQFTPIESAAWVTIRGLGTPLYPQIPVDRFFVDFANPYFKIGLELDGRDFHDPRKDLARDLLLMEQGWHIFRIPGFATVTPSPWMDAWEDPEVEGEEKAKIEEWMLTTSDGIITALDLVYFRHHPEACPRYDHAIRVLDRHRLAPFEIGKGKPTQDDMLMEDA